MSFELIQIHVLQQKRHFSLSTLVYHIKYVLKYFFLFSGHLLKNYSSPQYVPSCTVVRASGIKRPGKGPVVNKPDFIRPAHGRKVKRLDGQFVHRGDVLVTQNGLNYYPGENVGIKY